MSEAQSRLSGVVVPLVTPLAANGEIDETGLRKLVRRSVEADVAAVFAGGSAGAGPLLRDSQWQQMLETVMDEAGDKVHVLAGIIETSTARALDKIKITQRLGNPILVVTPTFYIALQHDAEMIAHFQACREATSQDLIIYNIPGCTGSTISVQAIRQMIEAGWAIAIKESSGDADYFRKLLPIARETGVSLLQGNETDIGWSLVEGAAGIVPVCANYDAALFVEAYNAIRQNPAAADEYQPRLDAVRESLLVGNHNWIAGITWGLHTRGIGSGIPPLPLQPVDDERKTIIEKLKEQTLESRT